MEENKTTRKLIYVDASGMDNNSVFKISLYDPNKNATYTLKLRENVINSTEAEMYAIYYAIYHIKKYNYINAHILCDNKSSVSNKDIIKITTNYKIGISWIPREANIIADKISKMEPTQKETQLNILEFIIALNKKSSDNLIINNEEEVTNLKSKISELEKLIETKNKKIQNQANEINSLKNKR